MIRFSRKEDYAIILINKLVENYKKRLVPLSEVAREYKISLLFLRNLANDLRQAGVVKAVEGKSGGYFLEKSPKVLKVGHVLSLFTNKPMLECCHIGISGKSICPKESFCQTGFIWRKLNKEFLEKIYNLSLLEFVEYNKESR